MWNFIKQYKSQFFIVLPLFTLLFCGTYFLNERNKALADDRIGATSVLMPIQGGTGTSTIPTLGQILVGQSNGKYIPTSTITATTTFTSIVANTLSLDSGVALSAGSFTASTTFDFKAGLNTGANAFRMQFYESLTSGIKNSGGYIQYDSINNYLEFGGIQPVTGVDVPGFRIARDTGIATFFGVNLPALTTIGGGSIEYTQDTALTLAGKTNSVNAARLNLWELANGSGGYIKYDGSANQLNFGTQTNTSTETNAISINRGSAIVNFNSSITTGKVIGGSATTANLSLQGTSGNGTLTSAGLKFLVGNNGATEAMTILNNGNVGIGTNNPSYQLDAGFGSANTVGDLALDGTNKIIYLGRQSGTSGDNSIVKFRDRLGTVKFRLNAGASESVYFGNFGVNYGVKILNTTADLNSTTSARLEVDSGNAVFPAAVFSTGDVGIGDIPTYDLDIQRVTAGGSVDARVRNLSTTGYAIYRGDADTASLKFGSYGSAYGTTQYRNNSILTTDGTKLRIANTSATGILTFHTGGQTDATEKMRLTADGYLGIGSTTPSNLLTIEKNSSNGEFIGSEVFESGKSVGLKTGVWKQGSGAYDLAGIWASPSTPSNLNYIFGTTGATSDTYLNTPTGKSLYFQVAGTSKITMNSSGYLGIGTTTPKSALQVTGTGTTTLWIGEFGKPGQFCLGTASTTASVCCYGDVTTGGLICNTTSTY